MRAGGSQRWLRALSGLNFAALVLVWAGERIVGERHWLTTLLAYAPQYPLGIPAALLLLWAALGRSARAAVANIAALLLFAFGLLGLQVPLRVPRSAAGPRLRVMTYNIHHAPRGAERTAAAIRREEPDVVCAQEAEGFRGVTDPMPELERLLAGWHSYRVGELALFSRHPFTARRAHQLATGPRRHLLIATIEVAGRRLTIINVHLNTAARPRSLLRRQGATAPEYLRESTEVRSRQVEELLEVAGAIPGPVVLAGDFNTPPRGRLYHRLAARFTDAFAAAGWGLGHTFRADLPVLRIDYVWAGPGVRALACRVPATGASDHLPVVADLALER
ncbi:MAG: endonuclease/exonuclease/phosphatase family protein [Armatimonadetes bacterium]|nr:endonuclease/exonuclease/phosphatase family protein [Armatimonadota bacterium]